MEILEPIEKAGSYWVHAQRDGDVLNIHVGNSMVRMLNLAQLPDHVRSQLAMIHAHDWSKYPVAYALTHHPQYPEELIDIGWMTFPDRYVLVLPKKVLEELRGERSHG